MVETLRGPVPPDPHLGVARPPLYRLLPCELLHARTPEEANGGQTVPVRVRHRARSGAPTTFPGAFLPGLDDLHHLRHRDRVPLSVGGGLSPDRDVRAD